MTNPHPIQVELTTFEEAMGLLQSEIIPALAAAGYNDTSQFAVRLSLEETLTNAFQHGNQGDPEKRVHFTWSLSSQFATFDVVDEGRGFDPAAVPDPTMAENLEIPSGRGLILVRSFMTALEILPPGNHVRLRYDRPR